MNARTDFVLKVQEAWTGAVPDWVETLAENVNATSQRVVARKLGVSNSLISGVLANKYPGDIHAIAEKVRGSLMGATVECPVMGEIGRDQCQREQKMGFTGASALRARLYRTCPTCPNHKGAAMFDPADDNNLDHTLPRLLTRLATIFEEVVQGTIEMEPAGMAAFLEALQSGALIAANLEKVRLDQMDKLLTMMAVQADDLRRMPGNVLGFVPKSRQWPVHSSGGDCA